MRPFVLLPLAALAFGFLYAGLREPAPAEPEEQLAPLGLPDATFTALAVDPVDPRRMYAQTEDGVFRTRDGGTEWRRMSAPPPAAIGRALGSAERAAPGDPRRLLEAGDALRLSTDGGRTWRAVLEPGGGVEAAAWSPSEPGVAYAIGGDGQLYRSDDGGASWLVAG